MAADSSLSNNHSPRSPSITTATAPGGNNGGGSNCPQSVRRGLPSPWAQVVRGEPESSSSSATVSASATGTASTATAPRSPASSPPISAVAPATPEQAAPAPSSTSSGSATPRAIAERGCSDSQMESSVDCNGNASPSRRSAWNRPVNGVIEPVSVMGGAVSWPALSETARAGPRSTLDSSITASGGSSSASQGQVVNQQSSQRQGNVNATANGNANATPHSNVNHGSSRHRPMRNRGGGNNNNNGGGSGHGGFNRAPPPPPPLPMRNRGGGNNNNNGGGSGQGGFNRTPPPPPLPPPFPVFEMPYRNLVPPVVMDSSLRGPRPIGGSGPPQHASNDHPVPRGSRRGHFGSRPRGDGQYHNNHGGRRDQDRRDHHMRQFVPPNAAFMQPPPPGTPPYGPLPVRPFPGPMSFDMPSPYFYVPTLPPESFRGMPLIAQAPPPPPMFYPVMEPNMPGMILKQIDYYFSDDNLVKDEYLRSNMDDEGWVPVSLIANFPRVAQMTSSTEFILDCMRASAVVEVQGEKMRRRVDWSKWLRTPARFNSDSPSIRAGESTDNALVNSIQNVSLVDTSCSSKGTGEPVDAQTDRNPGVQTAESRGQSELANGEGSAEDVSVSPS